MKAPTGKKVNPVIEEKKEMKSTENGRNKFAVVNQETKDAKYWENKVDDAMRRVRRTLAEAKERNRVTRQAGAQEGEMEA